MVEEITPSEEILSTSKTTEPTTETPAETKEENPAAELTRIQDELTQTGQNRERLLEQIRQAGNDPFANRLIEQHNRALERWHQLNDGKNELQENLSRNGWIFTKNGGFRVDVVQSKKGDKVISVEEAFGKTPVSKGQAFIGKLSQALFMPREVRNRIIEKCTWRGDNVDELYSKIPETQ